MTPSPDVTAWCWGGTDGQPAPLSHPSLLPQYLELLRSHQNRPAKCLTILWALGQAGFTDLAEGLRGESLCALIGSRLPGEAPVNCSSLVCGVCVCAWAIYVKH